MRRRPGLWMAALASGAIVSVACATSPVEEDDTNGASSSSSGGAQSNGAEVPERPDFDASFGEDPGEDDAGGDPESDASIACVDDDDPGGSENVAKHLPDTDDCGDAFKQVKGVMNGAVDVDFYEVSGKDRFGCSLETEFGTTTPGVELCVYATCKNGTPDAVKGCAAGLGDTSSTGMSGCCAFGPGKATPRWDCSGITDNDSADFVIRVRQAPGNDQCTAYTLSYRF